MPITFPCTCGKTLRVPDNSVGRRAKCPACQAVHIVPAPEPEFAISEEPLPPLPPLPPKQPTKSQPVGDDSDDGGTYRLGSPVPTLDDPTGRRPRGHPGLH